MTLVIAAPGTDFVVLGADSRGVIEVGSGRAEINVYQKIIQITKYASIQMFGASEEGNQLVEKYKEQISPKLQDVSSVAENFCKFCQDEERAIADVPKHPNSWVSFGFLVSGLKTKGDKFTPLIYKLGNYNGFRLGLCKPYAIRGKPLIAYYLFSKDYRADMTINEMCKLVAQSLYDTMQIDGDVGGPIRMAIIDSDGTREIPDSDINTYFETWDLRNLRRII
jgi:20S proteasome alpha/beta subunit